MSGRELNRTDYGFATVYDEQSGSSLFYKGDFFDAHFSMGPDVFIHREISDLAKDDTQPEHGKDIEGRDAHAEPRKRRDGIEAIAVEPNEQRQHRGKR